MRRDTQGEVAVWECVGIHRERWEFAIIPFILSFLPFFLCVNMARRSYRQLAVRGGWVGGSRGAVLSWGLRLQGWTPLANHLRISLTSSIVVCNAEAAAAMLCELQLLSLNVRVRPLMGEQPRLVRRRRGDLAASSGRDDPVRRAFARPERWLWKRNSPRSQLNL